MKEHSRVLNIKHFVLFNQSCRKIKESLLYKFCLQVVCMYLYTAHITDSFMVVYNSFIGRDWTSACKCTSGCHYQSIFDLTHPPNPCMERQTTTPRTAFPTLWQFVLIGPCLTSQTTGSCGYLRHPDKFSFICYAKRYQLSLFSGYKNHITLIAGCL